MQSLKFLEPTSWWKKLIRTFYEIIFYLKTFPIERGASITHTTRKLGLETMILPQCLYETVFRVEISVRNRMKSVKNIQKITKAMKMVAASLTNH